MMRCRQRAAAQGLIAAVFAIAMSMAQADSENTVAQIEQAETAYFRFDAAHARALFEGVWNNQEAPPRDRVTAAQNLARMEWRFDRREDKAGKLLAAAKSLGLNAHSTLIALARIERENSEYALARATANRAASAADTPVEQAESDLEYARATLSEAIDLILTGSSRRVSRQLLMDAFDRVDAQFTNAPDSLDLAEVELGLALLLGKGPSALTAWRGYFRIDKESATDGVLATPGRQLQRVLAQWKGQGLTKKQTETLVLGLAGSRLFEYAAATLLSNEKDDAVYDPRVQEVLDFNKYLRRVIGLSDTLYRNMVHGNGNRSAFKSRLVEEAKILWPNLAWDADIPKFSKSVFEKAIEERFGTVINFQNANGHFGLHMGHSVVDEKFLASQYGSEAEFRFVSLDFMVSNGYSSWFWDGRAQVGGWVDRDIGRVVQVRRPYINGSEAWNDIMDPRRRKKTLDIVADNMAADDQLARDNPYTYLPGLAARVRFEARERLVKELEQKGLQGAALRLAFVTQIERLAFQSSIVAHEGRHAIDSQTFANMLRPGAEKEYRAKLSEIAFASSPFLALGGGILVRNIGDSTSHGRANERIMKGLVKWMQKHKDEIGGLDTNRPLLPQLDLLTDKQLRLAARSMDPLAAESD